MKKLILSALLTILTVGFTNAQLTEGEVKYTIEASADDPSADDPSMDMAVALMQGSKMAIYFSGEKARTELDMGSMMSMKIIVDGDSEKILMLMGGMMGEIAIPSTTKELEELEENDDEPEVDLELIDESKKILGYTCKKAILTNEDGSEIIYWYTTEIEFNRIGQTSMSSEVPGFPLEFEVNQGGLIMSFTATEFNETLSDDEETLFSTEVPEGYTVMTMEDMKGMGM